MGTRAQPAAQASYVTPGEFTVELEVGETKLEGWIVVEDSQRDD